MLGSGDQPHCNRWVKGSTDRKGARALPLRTVFKPDLDSRNNGMTLNDSVILKSDTSWMNYVQFYTSYSFTSTTTLQCDSFNLKTLFFSGLLPMLISVTYLVSVTLPPKYNPQCDSIRRSLGG